MEEFINSLAKKIIAMTAVDAGSFNARTVKYGDMIYVNSTTALHPQTVNVHHIVDDLEEIEFKEDFEKLAEIISNTSPLHLIGTRGNQKGRPPRNQIR